MTNINLYGSEWEEIDYRPSRGNFSNNYIVIEMFDDFKYYKKIDSPQDTFSKVIKELEEEIFEYKAYNEGDSYNWEKVLKKANDFFKTTNNTESYHKLLEQKLETAKQLKEIHEDEICKLLAEWRIEVKQMEKDYIKKELVEKAINDWFKEVNGVVVLKYYKPTGKDYIWNIEEWKRLKEELRKSLGVET